MALLVKLEFIEHTTHQPDLIITIVDDKVAPTAELHDVAPQEACAEAVKGTDCEGMGPTRTKECLQALLQFAGSAVGKGHRKNVEGINSKRVDQVGDTMGKNAGLPTSWSSQYQHRPTLRLDRTTLGRVQTL